MCFSASASFIASGAIATIGAVGLTKQPAKKDLMLAAVPFIFALQQLIEGFVWLSFGNDAANNIAAKAFLFFAYGFWPMYIPIAVYIAERTAARRHLLTPFVAMGAMIALYGWFTIFTQQTSASIFNNSICYSVPLEHLVYGTFYALVLCLSFLLSSSRWLIIFGAALTSSLFFSYISYTQTGDSVWCFFSAILSVILIKHVVEYRKIK